MSTDLSQPVRASEITTRLPVAEQKRLMAEAIREWPQRVVDAGVKMADGRAYRPQARNIAILRLIDDPDALYEYVKADLNAPVGTWESPVQEKGWLAIVRQAGVELTYEGIVLDPDAPWADLFTNAERGRVHAAALAALDSVIQFEPQTAKEAVMGLLTLQAPTDHPLTMPLLEAIGDGDLVLVGKLLSLAPEVGHDLRLFLSETRVVN